MIRFQNKVALITGGGGNIGGATAKMLSSEGCACLVCDFCQEKAETVAQDIINLGGVAVALKVDVRKSAETDAAVAKAIELYGQLDILVSSAGGSARAKCKPLIEQTDDVIENMIGVNLFGALYFARAAAQEMVKRQYGKIITVASTVGMQGRRMMAEYSAAKGGVIAMTKTLAIELGQYNINVNTVSPGVVPPIRGTNWNSQSFMNKTATPEDLGSMIVYLASDEAHFINGANFVVDGGGCLGVRGQN